MEKYELRLLLRYTYAGQLMSTIRLLAEANGCNLENYPTEVNPKLDSSMPSLYVVAINQLNTGLLYEIFKESSKLLMLDYKDINFERTMLQVQKCWEDTSRRDVERDLTVPPVYGRAIIAALKEFLLHL